MALNRYSALTLTKDTLIKTLACQKLSQTLDNSFKSSIISVIKDIQQFANERKQQQLIEREVKQQQYEINDLKSLIKRQKYLLQRQASQKLNNQLRKIVKENRREGFNIVKKMSMTKKRFEKFIQVFDNFENRHQVKSCFEIWKNKVKESKSSDELKSYQQQNIFLKALQMRQRNAFNKWLQVTQQDREMKNLQINFLNKIFNKSQNQGQRLSEAFQKFKQVIADINKIKKLNLIYIRIILRRSLKQFIQFTQELKQKSRVILPNILLVKSLKYEQRITNQFFQNLKHKALSISKSQHQSKSKMAIQTITRILQRAQSSSYACGLNQIRNHCKLQKSKQQLFNSTLESFNDLMSDMLRQRYYSVFSAFKQHSLLKVHQRQVLIRTLLKSRTKGLKFFMKKWVSQIVEMKNQGEQIIILRIKQGKVIKSLVGQQETKRKTVAFYQWQKSTQEVITQQKVALTIRAMASASRIFDLFSQHSLIRKCLKQWRQLCHSVDSIQLGLQLLNTTYKRKMKIHLRAIKQQAKKKKHNKKSSKVKALLIFQVLTRIFQNRQHQALGALKCKSISVKADNDKIQLKQKKKEIHNQIVLLTEKDQKIRKQEAFLSMKEQKISEQEKEIKDKQKRIAEISKNAKEQARKLESKSPMSKTPTANKNLNIYQGFKMFNKSGLYFQIIKKNQQYFNSDISYTYIAFSLSIIYKYFQIQPQLFFSFK